MKQFCQCSWSNSLVAASWPCSPNTFSPLCSRNCCMNDAPRVVTLLLMLSMHLAISISWVILYSTSSFGLGWTCKIKIWQYSISQMSLPSDPVACVDFLASRICPSYWAPVSLLDWSLLLTFWVHFLLALPLVLHPGWMVHSRHHRCRIHYLVLISLTFGGHSGLFSA